jgi:hypothetical protein
MKTRIFTARQFEVMALVVFVLFPLVGGAQTLGTRFPLSRSAQTLQIDNGIHIHTTLTNTTVNMTGRSELHITAANDPIPGCVINLNSSDAWLFLENVQPSLVIANHLAQIQGAIWPRSLSRRTEVATADCI